MWCKSLDSRIRGELKSLNAGLLRLLVWNDPVREQPSLGLNPAIAAQLRGLRPDELEFIAGTPALLVSFEAPSGTHAVAGIADAEFPQELYVSAFGDPLSRLTGLFTAALLTWLWKLDCHDQLVMALCIGPERRLPQLGVSEIEAMAGRASQRLRVRFGDHPRFWPDLIRAAQSRDADLRALSRLAVLPLLLAEPRSR